MSVEQAVIKLQTQQQAMSEDIRAIDLALSTSDKLRGINEENAIKAIEAILKRQEKGEKK